MNLGENIFNAFDVVYQTYESINKLMDYCRAMASEKGEYVLVTPKFLRYRSDTGVYGWAINSLILLFQNEEDEELENGWRDGAIYLMEINLYEPDVYDVPMLNIAKYDYGDIASWSSAPVSPSDHKKLYNPLYQGYIDFENNGDYYTGNIKDEDYADRQLWGLRRISGCEIPLTKITIENAYDMIFGRFTDLGRMYPTETTTVKPTTVKPKIAKSPVVKNNGE